MKNFSIFIIGALLVSLQITHAANCYGGQITSTTIAGGYYYDSYSDLTHSNNDLYAVGSTGSYDFPYDQSYFLWTSPAPEDAIISLAGEKITTGGGGYEYGTSIYVDGDILCVSGNTDYPSWFPTYAYDNDWSTEGNYRDSFFVIFNRTSSERLLSQTWGDAYDNQQSLISCNQKHNLIVLASDSAPNYPARKRDYNSNDVRISVFELVSGYPFYDGYFGSIDADDVPVAVDVHERSGKLYILVAGTTYAQGNDSFPIYNAYQNMSAGIRSGFVWLLNPDNVTNAELSFYFSTFFGGYAYTDIGDAAFDESGNIYVVGTAAENLPMKNAFDSQLCDQNVEGGSCAFLAVFNLQGNLLFSSYLGLNWTNVYGVSIQRLSDGGHLVYITGQTSNLQNFPSVERFDRTLNESENYSDDAFITIVYVAPDFSRGEIRLNTLYGSTGYDFASGITFLPNNSFAIAGGTDGSDLQGAGNYTAQYGDTVITTFQCGSGLYGLNPSPTPAASLPPPSPPPATCESQGGCYQAPGVYVQFEEGDNGELIPSQTVYPSQNNQIVQEYFLNVKYLSLEERNANGDLVVTVPFPSSGYGITSEDTVSNGVNVQVVTFSTYLFNGAEVDVINYFFEEAGTLDFAGTTIAVEDSTSKVSLRISGWNFEDTSNTLTLTILLNIAPQPKGPATQAPSGNQTQFSWDTGATDCRVTTLSTIEIDNGVGTSTFKATSANLTVTFPYFEYYVLYDPGYAVLVKDDQKSSPKEEISPWAYVGAALGALVVVSAIVGIGYFVVSKQKRKTEKALSYRPKDVEMS